MANEKERDIVMLAFPSEDIATLEGVTTEGKQFMYDKYSNHDKQTIKGNEVNSMLEEIRKFKLTCSFKLPVAA